MNIALSTIVLFILLAPGFIFRLSYRSSRLSLRNANRNIINDLTWSIVPSIILQVAFIYIVEYFTKYRIDFQILSELLTGEPLISGGINQSFKNLSEFRYPIFQYNIGIFTSSYLLGYLSRNFIRIFLIDRKYRNFRFSNKWYYILTGECLDFPHVPDTFDDISFKLVDILCKVNGEGIIYMGELFDYYIDEEGNLEAIHLRYPMRRKFSED